MKPARAWRIAVGASLCLLAACGKSSRFDEAAVVDVCALVRDAEAEDILGKLNEPPKPEPGSGFAGVCHWRFTAAGGDRNADLTVAMVTHASNARGGFPTLGRWFEMNMAELKVSLDPHPQELKGIGDRAWVFGPASPLGSTLLMRQGQTFVQMRISSGGSAQLEAFARILSREFGARAAAASANMPAAHDENVGGPARAARLPRAAESARVAEPPRSAEPPRAAAAATGGEVSGRVVADATEEKERSLVFLTIGTVEQCVRADQLLRTSCDRYGTQLSDANRRHCALPAETFESRTAGTYREFKDRHRERIQASEPLLSTTLERMRRDFERQFATEVAGNLDALDLGTLNRLLGSDCSTVENEWLKQPL